MISTHQHLLILGNSHTLPLHNLQILQPTQNLMLHDERSLDTEHGSLLDLEGFVFQGLDSTGFGEVDFDVRATFDFES